MLKTTRPMTITLKTAQKTSHGTIPSGTWTYWIEENFLNWANSVNGGATVFSWPAQKEDGSDLVELVTQTIYFLNGK